MAGFQIQGVGGDFWARMALQSRFSFEIAFYRGATLNVLTHRVWCLGRLGILFRETAPHRYALNVYTRQHLRCQRSPRGGNSNTKPTVSVMKPGVTNNAPATASNMPSAISVAGTSPRSSRPMPRVRVDNPWRLSSATPTTAVSMTKPMVGHASM